MSTPGRAELARTWATAVRAVNFVPMAEADLDALLLRHVDRLAAALADGAVGPLTVAAADAGAALVTVHCTDPESVRRTVVVLGAGLQHVVGEQPVDVLPALAALAAGYADALRARTFDQQEQVKLALQRVLRLTETRFRQVFRDAAVGIAISDLDGALVETNRALDEIIGHDVDADARPDGARTLAELFGPVAADALRGAYTSVLNGPSGSVRMQLGLPRDDGDQAFVIMSVAALRDEHGRPTHHVTLVEDITDLHLLQERLNEQALRDVLTGLPNRQSFALRVEKVLGTLDPAAVVTLFHLDVDGFSLINNRLGNDEGDRVLRLVARRLQFVFDQEQVIIGRIAADEFAALVVCSDTTPGVATLARRINEELAEPVYLDVVGGIAVSASVGVVHRLAGAVSPGELLRQSNTALRDAQQAGRGQWAMFDAKRDSAESARFVLAAGLPGALEYGELEIEFAPLVPIADPAPVAVRPLLRWQRADDRLVTHDAVLDLADLCGATLPVATWALHAACAAVTRDADQRLPLAVSLRPAQAADPDLVAVVRSALDAAALPADRLWLAFPVATLAARPEADDNLRVLADIGVHVMLRGFDGGLAALELLEALPVRAVWLDGAAVRGRAARPGSLAARGLDDLVALAKFAGATVVVDG